MDFNTLVKLMTDKLVRFQEIEFAYMFGSVLKKGIEKAVDIDMFF